jgi:ABC-type uncharacterized transport system permease subunit
MLTFKNTSNTSRDLLGILIAFLSTFIPGFFFPYSLWIKQNQIYLNIALIFVVSGITVYVTKEQWWRRTLDFCLIAFLATLISFISGVIICSIQNCIGPG